ncbi:hypothetical protein LTR22_004259 [Elasticomyces elasticus]|nr:hypothetical protein LTR22_004259 [Elasticomyces elasticus]
METEDAVLHITDIQHATNGVNDGEATQANILLLPAELRIRIYEFCLVSTDVIDLADRAQRREPGVLAACRQIRFEALAIFYSENNFTATERDTESPSSDWARQIGTERCTLIKHLEVHYGLCKWNTPLEERECWASASALEAMAEVWLASY